MLSDPLRPFWQNEEQGSRRKDTRSQLSLRAAVVLTVCAIAEVYVLSVSNCALENLYSLLSIEIFMVHLVFSRGISALPLVRCETTANYSVFIQCRVRVMRDGLKSVEVCMC